MVNRNALRAWLSVVTVICSQIVAVGGIVLLTWAFPTLASYWKTTWGAFSIYVIGACVALVFVILFTRPKSVSEFLVRFKLQFSWSAISCSVIALGGILGCIGFWVTRLKLPHLAEEYALTRPFIHERGLVRYLFSIIALAGPIYEEILLRGYVYQIFRKKYDVCLSVVVVVALAMMLHSEMTAALTWRSLAIVTVQSVSCLILEKTNNLFNCIMFHCAYNAVIVMAPELGF